MNENKSSISDEDRKVLEDNEGICRKGTAEAKLQTETAVKIARERLSKARKSDKLGFMCFFFTDTGGSMQTEVVGRTEPKFVPALMEAFRKVSAECSGGAKTANMLNFEDLMKGLMYGNKEGKDNA
jgi:hypothetical protein